MGARLRRHDWASRLFDVIEEHRSRPFVWGQNDCCLFVSRAVDRMTDNARTYLILEQYSDEASALRLIASHGGLAGAVTYFMGDPHDGRPERGDVVLFHGGEADAVGICLGARIFAMGPEGLREIPRTPDLIRMVWRV